jgi:hypothetical protein
MQRIQRRRKLRLTSTKLQPHRHLHETPTAQQHRRALRPARPPRGRQNGLLGGILKVSGILQLDWIAVSTWFNITDFLSTFPSAPSMPD